MLSALLGCLHESTHLRRESMNTRRPKSHQLLSQRRIALWLASLLLVVAVGCAPASPQQPAQPASTATELPSTITEPPPTPTAPPPTAASEAFAPAGWVTYTSQRCGYALSLPADMGLWDEEPYSRTFGFKLADPGQGARNFVYISVIDQDIQSMGVESIYNYDPAEANLLLGLQVGESKAVRDLEGIASSFTYQRLSDTTIGGYAARSYENLKPWEFPEGTVEMRYYLSLDGCTYQIGGYLDTTQSNQPGAITEDLFNQILATIRVSP
jgi:hypothetical protein